MDTPISVLQDFCYRNLSGITPEYQLMSVEGVVHAPTFMYRVQIGEVVASSVGNSKKKAKHGAALSALETLLEQHKHLDGLDYFLTKLNAFNSESQPKLTEVQEEIVPENDSNPVGKLQEICMKKRWRPPLYDTVEEIGLPHERVFTMTCNINHSEMQVSVTGNGKSKKLAKRNAANEMILKLETLNIHHTENGKVHGHSDKRAANTSSLPYVPSSMSVKQKVDNFYQGLGEELNHELENYLRTPDNPAGANEDFCDKLKTVGDYIECSDNYTLYESNSDGFVCLASLIPVDIFSTPVPVITGWGSGPSEFEAKQEAAKKALSLFKTNRVVEI